MNLARLTRERANAILYRWKTGQHPRLSRRTIDLCLCATGDLASLESLI